MRHTVVTGVSRGLGEALFDELCHAGDRVLALGRSFTARQRTLARELPDRIALRQVDLRRADSLPGAQELADFAGAGDQVLLVHNAAVIEPFGAIGSLPARQIEEAVAVNLVAPMLLTNSLLAEHPPEANEPAGRTVTIAFITSSAAHRVSGGRAVYSATKRAAEVFFQTLKAQYAGQARVRVRILDPGIVDTPMQVVVRGYARSDVYFPDRQRFLERFERGELPSAAKVAARIVAQLAQEQAQADSAINGATSPPLSAN